MPKIVDPDVRRREVAEAVFRVVARHGVAYASLRNVADEAGLAIGSVRHYCGTHQELMAMVLETLRQSFATRFERHLDRLPSVPRGSPEYRRLAEDALAEFLPLDEPRRQEASVWLEFAITARTDPTYQPYVSEISSGMRMIVARIVGGLRDSGALIGGLDADLESDRLCAVLDGLTVGSMMPQGLSPDRTFEVLRCHLGTILRADGHPAQ